MDVADDDLMMDVADNDDLIPPLLPDFVDADHHVEDSTSSFSNSRKNNEASQANLKRTGRKQGALNKEKNAKKPNESREACPGSLKPVR